MKISNYDEFEYDYSTYWKNRNYEHFSEVIALKKLFKDVKGNWFLDIGGSYGRHLAIYYNKFTHPVIVDYSLNTLINNKERIWEKYPNTSLISANVYFLPFRDNSFDGSLMVRVLHHIEDTSRFFNELVRILHDKSTHIQEFANKMHIKARLIHFFKRDKGFFNDKPYQQPTKNQFEGSNGLESVFLNFHPKYIKEETKKLGFTLTQKVGVSYFRIGIIKKLIPIKILIWLESTFQSIFGKSHFAPSIFYKLKLKKDFPVNNYENLEDILVCPKCKSDLKFRKEECTCTKCKSVFEKVAGIWDFRVE